MSPPSGLIGGFGASKDLDTETTALLSGIKGEVEKVRPWGWTGWDAVWRVCYACGAQQALCGKAALAWHHGKVYPASFDLPSFAHIPSYLFLFPLPTPDSNYPPRSAHLSRTVSARKWYVLVDIGGETGTFILHFLPLLPLSFCQLCPSPFSFIARPLFIRIGGGHELPLQGPCRGLEVCAYGGAPALAPHQGACQGKYAFDVGWWGGREEGCECSLICVRGGKK